MKAFSENNWVKQLEKRFSNTYMVIPSLLLVTSRRKPFIFWNADGNSTKPTTSKKKFAMDSYFFSPRLTWRERFPSVPSRTERYFTGDLFDMMSATQAREKWSIVFWLLGELQLIRWENMSHPSRCARYDHVRGTAKTAAPRTNSSVSNKVVYYCRLDWNY